MQTGQSPISFAQTRPSEIKVKPKAKKSYTHTHTHTHTHFRRKLEDDRMNRQIIIEKDRSNKVGLVGKRNRIRNSL